MTRVPLTSPLAVLTTRTTQEHLMTTHSTTDLKPGDLARHPKHPELIGTVSYDYPGVLWVNYVGSNGYRLADHDLTDWERVEVVQPGHVQIKVDDLELHGWANTSPSDRWNDEEILSHRAAKAIAAQRAESTPPADEQEADFAIGWLNCPWCSESFTIAPRLARDAGGHVRNVGLSIVHTCPPAQPDEPQEFGAKATVAQADGHIERWLNMHAPPQGRRGWLTWDARDTAGSTPGQSKWADWSEIIHRGTVTLGWDE